MMAQFVAAALSLCAAQVAFAQPASLTPAGVYDDLAKDTKAQLAAHELPQIPATFALGLETTEIQRPGTMSELGVTLVNAFNSDSTLRTGMALELAPIRLWKPNQFTAEQWRDGKVTYGRRLLDSIAISAATAGNDVDAMGAKKPPLSSVGLRFDLVNTMDLRRSRDYYECVRKALIPVDEKIRAGHSPPPPGEDPTQIEPVTSVRDVGKQAISKCEDERRGVVLELAGALVATGEPAMGTSALTGERLWASFGGVYKSLGFTLQGDFQRQNDDRSRHSWFFGGRIDKTTSTPARFNVELEAYYADTNTNVPADRKRRLGLGATADLKFDSGVVLSLGAQARTDFSSDVALVVLTKISFILDGKSVDLIKQYHEPGIHP